MRMKAPEKRWKPIGKITAARCVLCGSERRGRIKGHGGKDPGDRRNRNGELRRGQCADVCSSAEFRAVWRGDSVAGLSALAIFLIANTIKLTIYARSNEIAIMRGCGRDERFYPGAVCGGRNDYRSALGAIIPILFTIFGYIFIYDKLGGAVFGDVQDDAAASVCIAAVADLIRIGMVVGLIGSFMSVTKYLRWKR